MAAHPGCGTSTASSARSHSLLRRRVRGKRDKRQQAWLPVSSRGLEQGHSRPDLLCPALALPNAGCKHIRGQEPQTAFSISDRRGDVCSSTCQTVTTCRSQGNLFLPSPSPEPGPGPSAEKTCQTESKHRLDPRIWIYNVKVLGV